MTKVVLVDENDQKKATKDKLQAHRDGDRHRAFSVFLFNSENEILLQQRAENKYHSSDLWSNTCCSHPKPKENIIEAGERRLNEELGVQLHQLNNLFSFKYKEDLENNITEHEIDHVLSGYKENVSPNLNPREVKDYKWVRIDKIEKEISQNPDKFTVWFKIIIREYMEELRKYLKSI